MSNRLVPSLFALFTGVTLVSASLGACSSSEPAPPGDADAAPIPTTTGEPSEASVPDASPDVAIEATTDAPAVPSPVETRNVEKLSMTCVAQPTDYGAYGPITRYERYELPNPSWVGDAPLPVQVLVPTGGKATHPVIFFSHPFGGNDWHRIQGFFELMVSHDYVVVFTPYATKNVTVCNRYDTLWGGHRLAVDTLGAKVGMDTARVGFVGHSFGAGATPWIAHEAIKARGWGKSGSFMLTSAPWYGYRMTSAEWAEFPSTTRLATLVYQDDTTNDHRMAIDEVFGAFGGQKTYTKLVSAQHGSACNLVADHGVPTGSATVPEVDALDFWGFWRQGQMIAACTLEANADACALLEGSTGASVSMGTWKDDGTAVPPAERSTAPTPPRASSEYTFGLPKKALFPCEGQAP